MATTTDRRRERSGGNAGNNGVCKLHPDSVLPSGTMAFADSTGLATDETDAGNNKFLGVVINPVSGPDGDETIEYARDGQELFPVSGGLTQAAMGKPIYAVDNDTLTLDSSGAPLVGSVSQVVDSTQVMVAINANLVSEYIEPA